MDVVIPVDKQNCPVHPLPSVGGIRSGDLAAHSASTGTLVARRRNAGGRDKSSTSVSGLGQVTTIVAASAIRWSFDHGGPNVARGP
jgi:hypothetical protein